MESSQIPSRIVMKQPFASGTNAVLTPILNESGNSVNYIDGFPSVYEAPASESGKYVTRGEMNAIGNLASNDLFYHKCGGLNVFDSAFCAMIGGYPKGAVLEYKLSTGIVRKVISLVDDNIVDFSGGTDTSVYTTIENGIVDNINWAYCDEVVDTESSVWSGNITTTDDTILGYYKADFTGLVSASVPEFALTEASSFVQYLSATTGNSVYADSGFGIIIKDLGTSIPSTSSANFPTWAFTTNISTGITFTWTYNNWNFIYNNRSVVVAYFNGTNAISSISQPVVSVFPVSLGHYYAIGVCGTGSMRTYLGLQSDGSGSYDMKFQINNIEWASNTIKLIKA